MNVMVQSVKQFCVTMCKLVNMVIINLSAGA